MLKSIWANDKKIAVTLQFVMLFNKSVHWMTYFTLIVISFFCSSGVLKINSSELNPILLSNLTLQSVL
jgi:hypothetical protein